MRHASCENGQYIVGQIAWKHKKTRWEQVTWDLVKMCKISEQRASLSALSVILDALGSSCSCHGSFGWTFVLMRTNGLHHFLPEQPTLSPSITHACLHALTFPYAHKSVSFRVGASVVCAVTDRQRLFILCSPSRLDGHGSIGNLSAYSLYNSLILL